MGIPEKRIFSCVRSISKLLDGNSGKNDKYKERVFPYLLGKMGDTFNFNDCAFSV